MIISNKTIREIKEFVRANWFTGVIILILWLSIEGLFSYNSELRKSTRELKAEIKKLEKEKRDLEFDKYNLIDSLFWNSLIIEKLKEKQNKITTENIDLKIQIKLLKDKYEKANNTANNFTTDSVRQYFSNFK